MSSGLRDFAGTFIARLAVIAIGVATQSILAWVLQPSGVGSYAVCLLFSTVLMLVFVIGFDYGLTYYVASGRFTLSEAVIYTCIYGGIGSGLAIVAGLALLELPLSFVGDASRQAFILALVGIPFAVFVFALMQLVTALGQFGSYAIFMLGATVLRCAFVTVLVWALDWGVEGALLADVLYNAVMVAWLLAFFRRKHRLGWAKPSWTGIRDLFSYGMRYYVGRLTNLVNFQAGTIILAFFATRNEIGLFSLATQLTARVMVIPETLQTVLLPRVAADTAGRPQLVAQCARASAVVCGTLLVILVVFADPIVALLFSPAFVPAVPIIRIVSVGVLVRCACKMFEPYLLGINRPGAASLAVAVGAAVNWGLLSILLPMAGLVGAGAALTGSYFVSSAILTHYFLRTSGMSLGELCRPHRSDWTTVKQAVDMFWRTMQGAPPYPTGRGDE